MTDNETKVPDEKHRIRQWLDAVLLKSGAFLHYHLLQDVQDIAEDLIIRRQESLC